MPRFGEYLRKTTFSTQGLFGLAKSVVKIAVIAIVSYMSVRDKIDHIVTLFTTPLWKSVMFIGSLAIRLIIQTAIATLILAVPDYLFQRHQYMESLKMSKQEVKEERKQQEGDPLCGAGFAKGCGSCYPGTWRRTCPRPTWLSRTRPTSRWRSSGTAIE